MAKRASKPKDSRSKEEVAAQKKTKGLKQPAISKARKEVAKEKTEKKAKGAKIEADAAPKRKKSSPSTPKTNAIRDPGPLKLDVEKTASSTPPSDRGEAVDDPGNRAATKRRSDAKRLDQIGNADLLSPAERKAMAELPPASEIKKEPNSSADPLRPKPGPLTDSVRMPFATGGAYTFDAPDRALESSTTTSQSTDAGGRVAKDLARRVNKGVARGDDTLNLPGTSSVRARALEIAKKRHGREVELGKAHPLDVPTDATPDVTTGHPMRQAIVETGFSASESRLREFANAKGLKFEDAVHGLFNTAQQASAKDSPVEARVRTNTETNYPEPYDAKRGNSAKPSSGLDMSLLNYIGGDIHRKEGPKPAIEPRDRPRLKAQNILEELTGPKKSGEFSGKGKGGVLPFGPREIDDSLTDKIKNPQGDLARSGEGKYAPEQVKDLPKPPEKKAKGFGGATDTMGGAIPAPTKNPRISRSDRGRRQTPASSNTYRSSRKPVEVPESTTPATKGNQFEQLELFPPVRILDSRIDHSKTVLNKNNNTATSVKTTELPETTKSLSANDRRILSSKQSKASATLGDDAFRFGTTLQPVGTPESGPINQIKPKAPTRAPDAPKLSSGAAYTQPFLETSLSQAKLAEKFPRDYAKVDSAGKPKTPTVWNMMSRQFLPGTEVETSKATRSLQTEANMIRGKKDTMFDPSDAPKSDKTNLEKS